jgi:hypothetical protein
VVPEGARAGAARAPRPAADPFFDRPYEPAGSGGASWEKGATAVAEKPATPARGLSPNIRPKKKVASLLGGRVEPKTPA